MFNYEGKAYLKVNDGDRYLCRDTGRIFYYATSKERATLFEAEEANFLLNYIKKHKTDFKTLKPVFEEGVSRATLRGNPAP